MVEIQSPGTPQPDATPARSHPQLGVPNPARTYVPKAETRRQIALTKDGDSNGLPDFARPTRFLSSSNSLKLHQPQRVRGNANLQTSQDFVSFFGEL